MFRCPKVFLLILVVSLMGTLSAAGELSLQKAGSVPSPTTSRNGVPSLLVREPVFEFNRNTPLPELTHDFKVENVGTGTLRIDEVAPD